MPKEIKTPSGDCVVEIKETYAAAIASRDSAVESAHRCGELLAQIANHQGELFADWLLINAPEIPRHHVAGFIRLSQKSLSDGITDKKSFLKLAGTTTEMAVEVSPEIKTKSHIQFVSQICGWFEKRTRQTPVSEWDLNSKSKLKSELKPLVEIYNSL